MFRCLSLLLFSTLFFTTSYSHAQLFEKKELNKVELRTDTGSLSFQTYREPIKVRAKPSRTYNWYGQGKLHSSMGGYDGVLLQGAYTSYHINKNIRHQGQYKKGLRAKLWKKWDNKGKLMERARFKKGRLQGKRYVYDSSGSLTAIEKYCRDKQHVGSSRVDLQACKLEYSIVSPK